MKKTVYLQRMGAIGDVILTLPIVEHLLKEGKKVIYLTAKRNINLFENFPHKKLKVSYNRNILLRLFRKSFFGVHKLRYEREPEKNAQEVLFDILNIKTYELNRPKLYLSEQEKAFKREKPYAAVHIESEIGLNYRQVFGIKWEEIVQALNQQGLDVVEIAKTPKIKGATHIPTKGLRDIMRVIHGSQFFIGIDSAPSHIATALKKQSFIFFGSVLPELRHVDFENIKIFQGECKHLGCYHKHITTSKQKYPICQIVGEKGKPPCCIFNNKETLDTIVEYCKQVKD